jgi:transcriptional regulator with XRE-family HTH domain
MKALGDRIGISQAQISQIEAGLSAPSLTTLFRLARALRVKLSDLFQDF